MLNLLILLVVIETSADIARPRTVRELKSISIVNFAYCANYMNGRGTRMGCQSDRDHSTGVLIKVDDQNVLKLVANNSDEDFIVYFKENNLENLMSEALKISNILGNY